MNQWTAPLTLIIVLIFGVLLFFTQGNTKKIDPTLPPDSGTFQPISLTPAQQQQAAQQQQQQAQQQAQQQQQQAQAVQPTIDPTMKASYSAVIKTSKGDITVNLLTEAAPRTVKNFLDKSNSKFYNNLTFHRVEDWVVQGGDPQGDGSGGGQMQTELNQLPFVRGSLGIARKNDIRVSNDAQFFITKTDASWLNQQYTNFGNVTDGLDVVDKITPGDKILSITVEQ